jgi:hypothetical protein
MTDSVVARATRSELEMSCGRAEQADNNPQQGYRDVVQNPTCTVLYWLAVKVVKRRNRALMTIFVEVGLLDIYHTHGDARRKRRGILSEK